MRTRMLALAASLLIASLGGNAQAKRELIPALEQLAAKENPEAIYHLGMAYHTGAGLPKNRKKALKFAPYDLRTTSDYFIGAVPIQPEKWVTSSDHPESITRRFESGEVGIAFDIAENGRVVNCRVTSESGYSRFDSVPCILMMRRARFKPPENAKVIQPGAHGQMRFRFDEAT